MSLWLAARPLVLASKSAARRALLEAAGVPVEIEPARFDERAVEARAGLDDAGDGRGAAGAGEGEGGGGRSIPTAWCSAPIRRWRWASGGFPRRPIAPARASSLRRCAARPIRCIPRWRWCAAGAVLFEHVDAAHLTMRAFSDGFLDSYLDAVGRRGDGERRRLSARRRRASNCSSASRAIISPCSACRCCRCCDWLRRAGHLAK